MTCFVSESNRFARYNRPGNRQSLPDAYMGTQTLPHPKGKRYGQKEGATKSSIRKSADDLDTSVSSQPGYLENMFQKEVEVYNSMQLDSSSDENIQGRVSVKSETQGHIKTRKNRKQAKEFNPDSDREHDDSDSEGSVDISLPVVRRRPESLIENGAKSDNSSHGSHGDNIVSNHGINNTAVLTENSKHSLNHENSQEGNITETSFPASSTEPVFHTNGNTNTDIQQDSSNSRPLNLSLNGIAESRPVPPERRKKITPSQNFNFDNSPDKSVDTSQVKRRSKSTRDRHQLYREGN